MKNHRELHVSQVNWTSFTSSKTEKETERQLLKDDVVVKTSVCHEQTAPTQKASHVLSIIQKV